MGFMLPFLRKREGPRRRSSIGVPALFAVAVPVRLESGAARAARRIPRRLDRGHRPHHRRLAQFRLARRRGRTGDGGDVRPVHGAQRPTRPGGVRRRRGLRRPMGAPSRAALRGLGAQPIRLRPRHAAEPGADVRPIGQMVVWPRRNHRPDPLQDAAGQQSRHQNSGDPAAAHPASGQEAAVGARRGSRR